MEWNPPNRKRTLTAEEAELWTSTMREVHALKRRGRERAAELSRRAEAPSELPAPRSKTPPASLTPAPPGQSAATASVRPKPGVPSLAAFDEKERRRLARDPELIDARLDLHGMRQREAHGALRSFLFSCYSRGARRVLVITGKGTTLDAERDFFREERGVLRRLVPQWLGEPELRSLVVSYTASHTRHGGEGALYVKLRKRGT